MKRLFPTFLITILLYLTVIYFSSWLTNFDAKSYNVIGALTLNVKSIYPDPAISRHPYLPFFLYLEAATLFLSQAIKVSQLDILKCFFTLFHLFSIYSVYHLSKKNIKLTFFYAINPISLLIIAFHGQFDIIPLSLILYSILLMQRKEYARIMLLLGIAFTLKTWPLLFIVPFLKRIPKKYWLLFILPPSFFLLLYSFFFHVSLFSIARVLAVYQGVGGIWGFGKVLGMLTSSKLVLFICKLLFVCAFFTFSFIQKKKSVLEDVVTLLLLFFIFTPGFGIQWFIWFTPFFFLSKKPHFIMLFIPLFISLVVVYVSWFPQTSISSSTTNLVLGLVYPFIPLYMTLTRFFPKTKSLKIESPI